jgi:hypothetical protein
MKKMTSHQSGNVPEVGFALEKTRLILPSLTRVVLRKLGEKSPSAN